MRSQLRIATFLLMRFVLNSSAYRQVINICIRVVRLVVIVLISTCHYLRKSDFLAVFAPAQPFLYLVLDGIRHSVPDPVLALHLA